ncbi:hypothetical protein D3C87_1349930 [compost metagenome]
MFAVLADAARHRIAEFRKRPAANAMLRIGGNIGHMEGAEGAFQRLPARKRQKRIALGIWCRMATCAATRPEQRFAIGKVRLAKAHPVAGCLTHRRGDPGENAETGNGRHRDPARELRPNGGHDPSPHYHLMRSGIIPAEKNAAGKRRS